MAAKYLVIVQFEAKSGIPADRIQHSFAFDDSVGNSTSRGNIVTNLMAFYRNTPTGGVAPPQSYLSPVFSAAIAPVCKFYDVTAHLTGDKHGSPVDTIAWGSNISPGTTGLPSELAACLSIHSDYGTDVEFGSGTRPRARDRGRLFFGPLSNASTVVASDATTKRTFLASQVRDDLTKAAITLAAISDPAWSVWSRRSGAFKNVTGGWMDDAFDVQRRRGEKAITRNTF